MDGNVENNNLIKEYKDAKDLCERLAVRNRDELGIQLPAISDIKHEDLNGLSAEEQKQKYEQDIQYLKREQMKLSQQYHNVSSAVTTEDEEQNTFKKNEIPGKSKALVDIAAISTTIGAVALTLHLTDVVAAISVAPIAAVALPVVIISAAIVSVIALGVAIYYRLHNDKDVAELQR